MNLEYILNKIANSSPLDFGDIFSKSVALFKKVWLQGFVHLLITIVVTVPLMMIVYVPLIILASVDGGIDESYIDSSDVMTGLSVGVIVLFVLLMMVMIMIVSALQFAITAHFYKVCKQVDREEAESSNYFMFLKREYLGKIFVLSLAIFGIVFLAVLLCYFPIFYVIVPLQFLGIVFAFNPDLSASDILKASFKLGNKIWLIAFGLIVVSSMLSQLIGMMLCFVGVFFTASFVRLPVYYMYKQVVGFDNEKGIEDRGRIIQ